VLAHVWEPFFTTKEAGKGTGLGLPTVRGIVRSPRIHHPENGRRPGTTFRSTFPPPRSRGKTKNRAPPCLPVARQRRAGLVVDDEVEIRDITAATLAHHGYRVLVAGDGTEAVALRPANDEISVVVTDLSMPNLDGAALANVVLHLNPAVKILMISGLSSGTRNSQMQRFGGAFLSKPFRRDPLA